MIMYSLLGAVEVRSGDSPIPVTAGRQRAVLAALLLHRNRVVSTAQLIDLLWPGAAPASARVTVQNYVMRLRKTLAAHGAGDRLLTRAPGYTMIVAPGELDLDDFGGLSARARAALDNGDAPAASALAAQALALWRGPALDGIELDLGGEVARLEESRLSTLEIRVTADIAQGRFEAVIPELRSLTGEHPLHEGMWRQLITALDGAGRRAEALAVFQEARRVLADQLGLEPSAALRALEAEILAGRPAAQPPAPAMLVVASGPAQLPRDIADFTGRHADVASLAGWLSAAAPAAPPVCVITGPGGVGKSTLAVHVAHEVRHLFPDGQLFVAMHDGTRPVPPELLAGRLLRDLGASSASLPDDLDERVAQYRSLLTGRRVLLVFDDVRGAGQLEAVLPGVTSCATIVTSRRRLAGLAGCRRLDLDVLRPEEARELFGAIAGPERVSREAGAVADIVEGCGYLPLAVRIAASRLAARPGWPVAELRDRLADTRRVLDELHVDELQIRTTFQLSYQALTPDHARAFRQLSVPDTSEITSAAAAALLALPEPVAERLAEGLVDVHLLGSPGPGRYRYHDLLRLFARDEGATADGAASRDDALGRLLEHYAVVSEAAVRLVRPGYLPEREGCGDQRFADAAEARAWLTAQIEGIVTTIAQAAAGQPRRAAVLARILDHVQWHLRSTSSWELWGQACQGVLATATRSGDQLAELTAREQLGQLASLRRRPAEAEVQLTAALALARELGESNRAGYVLNRLGLLAYYNDEFDQAAGLHQQALELFEAAGDHNGTCAALTNVAMARSTQGQYDVALPLLDRALRIAEEQNSEDAVAFALHHIARCQVAQGEYEAAVRTHHRNLDVLRKRGYREGEAYTLAELGRTHAAAGELHEAAGHFESAISAFRAAGDPYAASRFTLDLGHVHQRLGQVDTARALWTEALAVSETGDPATSAKLRSALESLPAGG
ncbi:AfsR/SARP family transcriptional regulator [Longispora albida]|uniref:AfsR/SARP family transcriptional regulator n=1 Tax=Longispora albida TaxID=203523 RepID=UPI0009FCAABC|nr:BTAD domain-containing putative transcriptional regulator [Longispora albida]